MKEVHQQRGRVFVAAERFNGRACCVRVKGVPRGYRVLMPESQRLLDGHPCKVVRGVERLFGCEADERRLVYNICYDSNPRTRLHNGHRDA